MSLGFRFRVSGFSRNVSGYVINRQRYVVFRSRNPLNNSGVIPRSWRYPHLREEARPGIRM
jgi:hypothetical protein